jgi:hypothetical protein
MVAITTPSSTIGHMANTVSRDGSMILGAIYDSDVDAGFNDIVPFRWTQSSGVVPLVTADGRHFSWRGDPVNDASRFIGRLDDNLDNYEAAVWTVAQGAIGLGILPGDNNSAITAVSPDGTKLCGISFKHYEATGTTDPKVVYWDGAGIHSLNAELTARGADLRGFDIIECSWISNGSPPVMMGQLLTSASFDTYSWVATLSAVEPSDGGADAP